MQFDALPFAVFSCDGAGQITRLNTWARQHVAGAAAGAPLAGLFHEQALIAQAISNLGAEARLFALTLCGSDAAFDVHLAQEEGGIIATLTPSSHQLLHKDMQHRAMQSASQMADMLIHELRNPLAGIKGAAQLLARKAETGGELCDVIVREVERMGSLLSQVEYFSTHQAIETGAVNIHEVLRHVLVLCGACADDVQWKEVYDPSLPHVEGNFNLLVQVFVNLIKNAVESTAGQKVREVRITTAYQSGYRLKGEGGEYLPIPILVQVQDNGKGIAPVLREHIFEPFITDKTRGKGLGLPIVAKIVQDHGGRVELAHSEAGKTVFSVHLPMAARKNA